MKTGNGEAGSRDLSKGKKFHLSTSLNPYFYVTDETEGFAKGIKAKYDHSVGEIIIEGLADGSYTLHVMASDGDLEADSASLHSIDTIDDDWLTFDSEQITSLTNTYYHRSHTFEVESQSIVEGAGSLTLSRIVGRRALEFDYGSDYVHRITTKIEIAPTTTYVYSAFSAKAQGSKPKMVGAFEVTDNEYFTLPPSASEEDNVVVRHYTQEHNGGVNIFNDYSLSGGLDPNSSKSVKVEFDHPMRDYGVTYLRDTTKFPQILLDGESYEYVNNRTHRQFSPAAPLQMTTIIGEASTQFHARFYSVVAVNGVSFWGRPTGYSEDIEIAHFDYLPQMGEYFAELPKGERKWKTKSGKVLILDVSEVGLSDFYYQSEDEYLKKIDVIAASACNWSVGFSNFGADPITGASSGQWQVMTAQYARAAVALLTNMAYQFALQDFHDYCLTFQDRIYSNDTITAVDMSTICYNFLVKGTINAGATTDYGLAGGNTWGITTGQYFTHYYSPWAGDTAFHELAHCLGYSHDSCMASYGTGLWCAYSVASQSCALGYYHSNISTYPVPSVSCLTIDISSTEPSQYAADATLTRTAALAAMSYTNNIKNGCDEGTEIIVRNPSTTGFCSCCSAN